MKTIYSIALMFMAIQGFAQDSSINSLTDVRTTLVHNQLSPEIVKLENASGFSSGSLTQSGKTVNHFQERIFSFSTFPFTVLNKPYQQLFIGVGHYKLQFNEFQNETSSSYFSKRIESFYVGAAFSYRLKKKVFGLSYVQSGFNGTDPFQDVQKSFNVVFVNKFLYKASRNKTMGLGFAYFTNMGYPLILPAVTYTVSRKHHLINIDFPLKAEVEGILFNGRLRPVVGTSFHGGNYYLKNSQHYLYNYGALGYAGMRFKVADLLYLYSGYQIGILDVFKTPISGQLQDIGTLTGQQQWVISLNVQFAKFIPLHQP